MDWLKRILGRSNEVPIGDASTEAAPVPSHAQSVFVAFQPHNDIERLLMDAAANPAARMTFQRALLESDLCVATPEAPPFSEHRVVSQGESLQLLNVQSPDGEQVPAVFTAQERIVDVFGMGVGFVAMKGEDLLPIIATQGAWLNPGFPYSVYWTPSELAAIIGKPVPRTIKHDTKIMLGVPAEPPAALIASLKAALGSDNRIAEAWLALAHWPEDGASSWYLDVRTDLAGPAVQALLAETFRQADYAGRPLDMIVNSPNGKEGVGIRVAPSQTH